MKSTWVPTNCVSQVVSDSGLVHLHSALSSPTWEVICCFYYFNRISFHLFLNNFLPVTNVSCLYSFQLPPPLNLPKHQGTSPSPLQVLSLFCQSGLLGAVLPDRVGLTLCSSRTGSHSCREFVRATALPHPEDRVLKPSSPSSGSDILLSPFPISSLSLVGSS